jgi:hypothetical protein
MPRRSVPDPDRQEERYWICGSQHWAPGANSVYQLFSRVCVCAPDSGSGTLAPADRTKNLFKDFNWHFTREDTALEKMLPIFSHQRNVQENMTKTPCSQERVKLKRLSQKLAGMWDGKSSPYRTAAKCKIWCRQFGKQFCSFWQRWYL